MTNLELIKKGVRRLYEKHPNVHLDVSFTHPKLHLENDPVVIKGVYANLFRIEEYSSGYAQCHSLQYADVLTGHIRIHELNTECKMNRIIKKSLCYSKHSDFCYN